MLWLDTNHRKPYHSLWITSSDDWLPITDSMALSHEIEWFLKLKEFQNNHK